MSGALPDTRLTNSPRARRQNRAKCCHVEAHESVRSPAEAYPLADPIDVVAFVSYLNGQLDYRPQDYPAKKFVDALKGRPVNMYADLPNATRAGFWRLTQASATKAMPWFVDRAAAFLSGRPDLQDAVFVPMPSSRCVIGRPMETDLSVASLLLAARCRQKALLLEALRWDMVMQPAHRGGPRSAAKLYPHLRAVAKIPSDRPIVLVDDVYTAGGHVQAATAKLEAAGGIVVLAVVAARMVYDYPADPFGVVQFDVARFTP